MCEIGAGVWRAPGQLLWVELHTCCCTITGHCVMHLAAPLGTIGNSNAAVICRCRTHARCNPHSTAAAAVHCLPVPPE
jgi:hypothetical protein